MCIRDSIRADHLGQGFKLGFTQAGFPLGDGKGRAAELAHQLRSGAQADNGNQRLRSGRQ